jgi:transcriptional regulator with XRE-family HTH domain
LKKVKQKEIAKVFGVTDSCISQLLSGKRGLTWPRAKEWAAKLKIRPSFLMDADPEKLRKILTSKVANLNN